MKIVFNYADGEEESASLTEAQAKKELMMFLNRFSDAGKKQWMSRVKNKDRPLPLDDGHFDQFIKRFLERG